MWSFSKKRKDLSIFINFLHKAHDFIWYLEINYPMLSQYVLLELDQGI